MADYTPEQIEEMRSAVAAADAAKAAEREALRQAYLAPVRALVQCEAFQDVISQLEDMRSTYAEDGNLSIHVNALAEIMPRLAGIAALPLNPPAPPAPEGDTDGE